MIRKTWNVATLEEVNNTVKLEQVLHLAEEMFDSLASRIRNRVDENYVVK